MINYKINNYKKKSEIDFKEYVLGCDIGGTNTNIAVAGIKNMKPSLIFSLDFHTKNLKSITPAINNTIQFAYNNYKININSACIGAAGLISKSNNYAKLTNANWNVDKKEIKKSTSLINIKILNDFQLIGYGINLINFNDTNSIITIREDRSNNKKKEKTRALIGAGTGFGKATLYYDKKMNIYIPKPSEGGHSDLPIYNDFEMKLALYIKSINKSLNPINYEDVLSGKGIINIYEFIRTSKKFKESKYTKEIDNKPSKSELISKYRLKDKNCKEVFKIFTIFYARCAKNFVLDTLSTGGLFIAGGITNKNREIFHSKIFLNEFNKNTNQSKLLQDIPIYLIIDHNIGLKGACYAAILNDEKQ